MAVCTVGQMLEVARSWIGYQEKKDADPAFLDSKTANVGRNNFQRFQPLCGAGNGDQWCQYTIGGFAREACGGSMRDAQTLLWMPKQSWMTGYTPDGKSYFVAAGRWRETPEAGDVVYFYVASKGRVGHVGLVEWVDKTNRTFGTIEGNTSSTEFSDNGGCVARHTYSYAAIGGTYRVNGFGRPAYQAERVDAVSEEAISVSLAAGADMGEDQMGKCLVKDPDGFVRLAYATCLGREPDEGGLKTWTDALTAGADPGEILSAIASSEEGAQRLIGRAYVDLLGRYPRQDEIDAWKQVEIDDVIRKIRKSREYAALHLPAAGES